ncbi:MAG TPA: hypothetical protein VMW80_02890 [Candidatus Dormibacteraeota bacterium]|nr:hypothetical protein [Candidatus Dormibacteraeota bacterium]
MPLTKALQATASSPPATGRPHKTKPFSVRLDAPTAAAVRQRSAAAGCSPGELVRRVLTGEPFEAGIATGRDEVAESSKLTVPCADCHRPVDLVGEDHEVALSILTGSHVFECPECCPGESGPPGEYDGESWYAESDINSEMDDVDAEGYKRGWAEATSQWLISVPCASCGKPAHLHAADAARLGVPELLRSQGLHHAKCL